MVRDFARFNRGDPSVYYVFNNVLLVDSSYNVDIPMSETVLNDMMEYGIYSFFLFGHWFFLEIFPIAFQSKGLSYLKNPEKVPIIHIEGNEGIFELKDIEQIDFLMQRFHQRQ